VKVERLFKLLPRLQTEGLYTEGEEEEEGTQEKSYLSLKCHFSGVH